jgi:peptidoglycan hydrolase-like protein with peptidoglycan-binding domain
MIHPLLLLALAFVASNRKRDVSSSTPKPSRPAVSTPTSAPTRAPEEAAARAAIDALPEPIREPVRDAVVTNPPMSANETARALALHLRNSRSFGTKNRPDRIVAQAQRDLGVKPADGVVGPSTRAAARRAGVTLPLRSAAT